MGQVAQTDIPDAGQRPIDAAQDIGDTDLIGGQAKLVSAVTPPVATHEPIGAQVREDVGEELRGNTLRIGQIIGFDHGTRWR